MRHGQLSRTPLAQPWPGGLLRHDDLLDDYRRFLQPEVPPEQRREQGLEALFRQVFPIKDFCDTAELAYVSYQLDAPRQTPDECRRRGETYGAPLRATIRLIVYEVETRPVEFEGGLYMQRQPILSIRDIKEQEIYFGEIPVPGPEGTFIVRGIDRVVTRQLGDSPGIRFTHGKQEHHSLQAHIRPRRGSWLSFEQDRKGGLFFRIDNRKKKLPATLLLRAIGLDTEAIIASLCEVDTVHLLPGGKLEIDIDTEHLKDRRAWADVWRNDELIVRKHRKFTRAALKKLASLKVNRLPIDSDTIQHWRLATDVIDPNSGEILREPGDTLNYGDLARFARAGIPSIRLIDGWMQPASQQILDTLRADRTTSRDEALCALYSALRPGDAPTVETARYLLDNLFFNPSRYDLSNAGRTSLNRKLHAYAPELPCATVLTVADIVEAIRELQRRQFKSGSSDDTSDLGEAVSRDVGSLLGGAIYIGLIRMERAIKERMSMSQELDALMPHDLINARPLAKMLDEFLAFSRLSERVDIKNPVAELSQRRKLSFSGLDRAPQAAYRASDTHASWLGRLCPIEAPRGGGASPSLACLIDEDGHILSTSQRLDRHEQMQDPDWKAPEPWEMLGPVAALIPFVERDAPETALLGAAALRSALPPLRPEPPLVGTGLEAEVAHASGLAVYARNDGVVRRLSARSITIVREGEGDGSGDGEGDGSGEASQVYPLHTNRLAPQGARLHQHPVVRLGQRVRRGDLLAVGPGVIEGEVALGHNLLAALLPGHTFGPSLIVSERALRDGCFTSAHLREYRVTVSASGRGDEAFTRDIPGAEPDELEGLDERGLPMVGRRVEAGDILVGKICTPPASFNDEPDPPLDLSLRVPAGHAGVVIQARIDGRRDAALPRNCRQRASVVLGRLRPLEAGDLLGTRHGVRGTVARIVPVEDMPVMPDGRPVDVLLNPGQVLERGAAGLVVEMLAGQAGIPLLIPPFSGVTEGQLTASLGATAATRLRDGATGEWLDQPAAVGPLYMLKLPPLAGDVFEARSTGPYDPLTEQPTAGQGHDAGQELDEETIAALMAHGAGYTLRELLQHKSDDPAGRASLASALTTHDPPEGHVPASLDALMRELRAGALDVQASDPDASVPPAPPHDPPRTRRPRR